MKGERHGELDRQTDQHSCRDRNKGRDGDRWRNIETLEGRERRTGRQRESVRMMDGETEIGRNSAMFIDESCATPSGGKPYN